MQKKELLTTEHTNDTEKKERICLSFFDFLFGVLSAFGGLLLLDPSSLRSRIPGEPQPPREGICHALRSPLRCSCRRPQTADRRPQTADRRCDFSSLQRAGFRATRDRLPPFHLAADSLIFQPMNLTCTATASSRFAHMGERMSAASVVVPVVVLVVVTSAP
jgi:hypothetical protein